ncbi:MAG TPA: D-alanine--D-alanine ligase family protein [Polyangiaceae bacterium]
MAIDRGTRGTADGRLRVAVLCGGRSAEHEISLLSARFVLESLDPSRFVPVLVGIDKNGRWLSQKESHLLAAARDPRKVALDAGEPAVLLAPEPGAAAPLGADVVFPVLHGPMGEDGTVQGLLELAGVPYVGSGVLGSAVGMDKDVMKRLLRSANLPVLPYAAVRRARWDAARDDVLGELSGLGAPLFVKPANLGSSVGVSKVSRSAELAAAVDHAFSFDDKVVVEMGLERPREIECAVLGGEPPFVSEPGEIVVNHADGYYSYAAKYLDDAGVVTRIPAELTPEQAMLARSLARATFVELGADDLARVDLFLDSEGGLWINEINTMPGFTAISMFPKLMEASGVPARELVTRLIEMALERARRKQARSP